MTKISQNSVAQCFTREMADEQYNPTLWTPRLPIEELLPKHIEFTNQNSYRYRATVPDRLSQRIFGEGEFSGAIDL